MLGSEARAATRVVTLNVMQNDVGLNVQIRDDRGKLVTVTGRANNELSIFRESVRGGDIFKEKMKTSWTNLGWIVLMSALAAAAGYLLRFVAPGFRGTVWVFPACWLTAYAIGRVTHVNWARKRVLQQKVRAILATGVCPACDYELRSIPVAVDGCTICPECGAAWRRGVK